MLPFVALLSGYNCNSRLIPSFPGLNREVMDEQGNPMLLGPCSRQRLEEPPFGSWFNQNYREYQVDSARADRLRPLLSSKQLIIFMGTWCGDSRREVPRIYKLLDYCGFPAAQVRLILLSNQDSVFKQSPLHEEQGLNIHRVPDLLVFSHNRESGRIVESPVVSWEQDLLAISDNQPYIPNYRVVPFLVKLFHSKKLASIEKNIPQLLQQLRPLATTSAELRSYGYILMATRSMDRAGLVFRLNTLLYPSSASAFFGLGEFYEKTGNTILAKDNYKRSLALQPTDAATRKKIQNLEHP